MSDLLDLIAALLLLIGSALCFGAAVSLVRFPDLLSKMHSITKPQVLGILCVTAAIALSLRTWAVLALCLLNVVMQLATAPVAATMVGRSAYRSGLVDSAELVVDQLAEDLSDAGFAQGESSTSAD